MPRVANSHVLLRKWERMMRGFRSAGGLWRFTSVFSAVHASALPIARCSYSSPIWVARLWAAKDHLRDVMSLTQM
jgi:hypothetical protein